MDIFTTFQTYAVLQDSKIEGLDGMVTKYQVLYFKTNLPPLSMSKTNSLK